MIRLLKNSNFKKILKELMKRITIIILIMIVVFACSKETFFYKIDGNSRLKDQKTVQFDMDIYFKTAQGVKELKNKEERIKHAIRIILAQRGSNQLGNVSRFRSIVQKIFISQLKSNVEEIKINTFSVN